MMNAEQVRGMVPQWLQNGRNMVPAPYRNHPEVLNYMANNSVLSQSTINAATAPVIPSVSVVAKTATPTTPTNTVWQWYDNGTEMIPYRNQDELQRILAGNSTPKPAAPTSTVTRAAVELSDEALYTGMHVADDGVGAALRGAGHNMPAPTVTVPTSVKAPLNPGSVPVTDLKNVTLNMPTSTPVVPSLTPEAKKALQMAEDASKPFSTSAAQINQNLGIGIVDKEADLLRRKLAVQESGGRSAFRDISREWTGRSKALAEQADDAAKIIDKTDDVAKGFNWGKAGKIGAIVLGAAALIGGAIWLINKLNKKDEAPVDETPVDETPVDETPATTEAETPKAPEAPVAPVAPIEPEVPVVPVDPTEPELPVAPTEATEPEAPVPPVKPTETDSVIDANGKMTVQKGDGPWHLAERYLADKFKNEPEKFANLPKKEQNKMIHKKMMEIVELYKKQLAAEGKKANVRFEERIINGKKQTVVVPGIYPGQKIQVVEILDKAA